MKYLICGKGTIGSAWGKALESWGHNIEYCDPDKDLWPESEEFDGAFVCVPTPTYINYTNNEPVHNFVYVDEAIRFLDRYDLDWISIRSTVLPGMKSTIKSMTDKPLIAHPEFLRSRHAEREAKDSRLIVVGGESPEEYIEEVYQGNTNASLWTTSFGEAFFIKYAANIMFATKVIYANTMKKIHEDLFDHPFDLSDGHKILNIMDKIFAGRHMDPSHGDKPGYDGECLPKDTKLWYGQGYELIDTIVDINERLREE